MKLGSHANFEPYSRAWFRVAEMATPQGRLDVLQHFALLFSATIQWELTLPSPLFLSGKGLDRFAILYLRAYRGYYCRIP